MINQLKKLKEALSDNFISDLSALETVVQDDPNSQQNTIEEVQAIIGKTNQIMEDYLAKDKILTDRKEELEHTEADAEYLACISQINKLSLAKAKRVDEETANCKHNLFYLSAVDNGGLSCKAQLICVICGKTKGVIMQTNRKKDGILSEWSKYSHINMIVGYDETREFPFVPATEYLGKNAQKKIEDYYIFACDRVIRLRERAKKQNSTILLTSIPTPEELTVAYFSNLFKQIDNGKIKQDNMELENPKVLKHSMVLDMSARRRLEVKTK